MGVAGASYGGYAVNWIISQQPDRFKAPVRTTACSTSTR
jgi:dipeptidyl aminopeptidase/acylaminoacyl peptidase